MSIVLYNMTADDWTREIFEAFVKVLRRPRYNLNIGEISDWKNYLESGFTVNIETSWGETLKLNIYSDRTSAKIQCFDNSDESFEMTGFHYLITFSRRQPAKVRKAAITFAEKIRLKPVYDCLLS